MSHLDSNVVEAKEMNAVAIQKAIHWLPFLTHKNGPPDWSLIYYYRLTYFLRHTLASPPDCGVIAVGLGYSTA